MKLSATPSRLRTMRQRPNDDRSSLAKWQAIASIAASIAIPLVLAVFGFTVQRQLAAEGLKKDYVQIATSILKENPSGQDKELRKWAVEVLDRNADIPFSESAKSSLEKGFPLVRSQLIFPEAPAACLAPPKPLRFDALIRSSIKGEYIDIADQKQFLLRLSEEAHNAETISARLQCLQEWVHAIKRITAESNDKQYGLTPSPLGTNAAGKSAKSVP